MRSPDFPPEPSGDAAGGYRGPPGGADQPRSEMLSGKSGVRGQGAGNHGGDLQPPQLRPVSLDVRLRLLFKTGMYINNNNAVND